MKKQALYILATSSLVVMLATTTCIFAASSTRIETELPFDFTVGNKTLPAGTYTITEESHDVLRVRSVDHRSSVAILTNVIKGKSPKNATCLIFKRYGDRYFLRQAWLGLAGGYELGASRIELELAKERSQREPEVITIVAR